MVETIKESVRDLSWNKPKDRQQFAIEHLSSIDEKYYDLIFDKNQKDTWENAVVVIKKIGSPKNAIFFPVLIWLLQDINWPGAKEALEILAQGDKSVVLPIFEQALIKADQANDRMWIGGLNWLAQKADLCPRDFSDTLVFELLKKADF